MSTFRCCRAGCRCPVSQLTKASAGAKRVLGGPAIGSAPPVAGSTRVSSLVHPTGSKTARRVPEFSVAPQLQRFGRTGAQVLHRLAEVCRAGNPTADTRSSALTPGCSVPLRAFERLAHAPECLFLDLRRNALSLNPLTRKFGRESSPARISLNSVSLPEIIVRWLSVARRLKRVNQPWPFLAPPPGLMCLMKSQALPPKSVSRLPFYRREAESCSLPAWTSQKANVIGVQPRDRGYEPGLRGGAGGCPVVGLRCPGVARFRALANPSSA